MPQCSFLFWELGYRKEEQARVEHVALPGLEELAARPTPKLRASRVYASPGSPFFPPNKSVGDDTSIAEALRSQNRTRAVEEFEIGTNVLRADCESQAVGYRGSGGRLVERVITLARWKQ